MKTQQLLNAATSGNSSEFAYRDSEQNITLRLSIVGTSTTPITAYVMYPAGSKGVIIAISGITGGGTSVKIQLKPNYPNAVFSDTGDVFTQDDAKIHYYN